MRARALAPGLAAAGVLAASGCGSDGTSTVTVTRSPPDVRTGTTAATTTARSPSPPTTTTTVVRRVTRTTPPTRRVAARTVTTEAPRPASTEEARATDPDPVGGTFVPAGPRARGAGYTVAVPTGWFDGARRYEGNENAFDLSYVKRQGAKLTSNIFTNRSRQAAALASQPIDELAADLRRGLREEFPDAEITRVARIDLDGEPAQSYDVRRVIGGIPVAQRQVVAQRARDLVVVRLTSPAADFLSDGRTFRRFLRSWRWR